MSSHFTFFRQSAQCQVAFVNSCFASHQLNPPAPLVICHDVVLVGEALVQVSLLEGFFLDKRSHPPTQRCPRRSQRCKSTASYSVIVLTLNVLMHHLLRRRDKPACRNWSSTPRPTITTWPHRCINLESARRAQPLEVRAAPGVLLAIEEGGLRLLPFP